MDILFRRVHEDLDFIQFYKKFLSFQRMEKVYRTRKERLI